VTDQASVRNPSAVASMTDATSQRRQPLHLLILEAPNVANGDKPSVCLVRIEKIRGSNPLSSNMFRSSGRCACFRLRELSAVVRQVSRLHHSTAVTGTQLGYARVSTTHQSLDQQMDGTDRSRC
jgi:hypothetical protein